MPNPSFKKDNSGYYCYGDIPHDVTAWTLPNTINSD